MSPLCPSLRIGTLETFNLTTPLSPPSQGGEREGAFVCGIPRETMICIPIIANNLDDALHDMAEASMVADIVELRIDYIKDVDLKRLLEKRTKPVIVTNRPVREGGKFNGSEEERIALLKLAIRLQADYVDIEHDSIQHISRGTEHHAPTITYTFRLSLPLHSPLPYRE